MLSDDVRRTVADALRDAEVERAPIPPLRDTWPDIDVVDSYEIQLLNIRRRLEAGARVNGHKVGLSSKAMQEMMGVDEPDYGHLLSDMEVSQRRAGAGRRATATPASRSRSRSSSARRCRARAAPRTTSSGPPSTSPRRSS